ncbi:unnamed protein product [Polarella glacialis]|uniref:C2 domain-containing protein n=1 Tax=Polarella glacialis TaxID=89957 RepID=A0A813FT12_POLGL|nr:unnamed protein product [Polarella glacialis]
MKQRVWKLSLLTAGVWLVGSTAWCQLQSRHFAVTATVLLLNALVAGLAGAFFVLCKPPAEEPQAAQAAGGQGQGQGNSSEKSRDGKTAGPGAGLQREGGRKAPASQQGPPHKPKRPLSPKSAACVLVGARLSTEQARTAAEKIVALRLHVAGQQPPSLDLVWSFFDMPVPSGLAFDSQDQVFQSLKAKLNRQRLLFHPDKNCHPEAELTFKFLEQCHQRLVRAFTRGGGESVHQRTRREEEELKKEQERRRQEKEEWRRIQEQRRQEEEQRARDEEVRVRRTQMDKERLQVMLQAKEAQSALRVTQRTISSNSLSGLFAATCSPKALVGAGQDDSEQPVFCLEGSAGSVGCLRVQLLAAKDLPADWLFGASVKSFAIASVGSQQFTSPRMSGCNPEWSCSFEFDVHRVDTSFCVTVYREGWFDDDPLGRVEIPFLDIEEWSGCQIGRVLQPLDPYQTSSALCMALELKASFEWF